MPKNKDPNKSRKGLYQFTPEQKRRIKQACMLGKLRKVQGQGATKLDQLDRNTTKQQKMNENFKKWNYYFRNNPHRFVMDYLQVTRFNEFQALTLYAMFQNSFFMFWASRGIGKTYLTALFCIVYGILYPMSKIVVVSKNMGQATLSIKQIQEFSKEYPMIAREIMPHGITIGTKDAEVKLRNGTIIRAVSSTEGIRGNRGNVVVLDEFVLLNNEFIKSALQPLLTYIRTPEYKIKMKRDPSIDKFDKRLRPESNKQIYLSSAKFKDHWSWDKAKVYLNKERKGGKYFVFGVPYHLGIHYGMIHPQAVQASMEEEGMDDIQFQMEYGCMPFGQSEKAYFKLQEFADCQRLQVPVIPYTTEEYLRKELGDEPSKGSKLAKLVKMLRPVKKSGEVRVLAVDVASHFGGKENDASSITFIRGIPSGQEYVKLVPYLTDIEGKIATEQALIIKRVFYDLECDYMVIDANGIGSNLFGELGEPIYDEDRDTSYPAWKPVAGAKKEELVYHKDAVPVMYPFIYNQRKELSEMNSYLKLQFEKKLLHLLVDEREGREYGIREYGLENVEFPQDYKFAIRDILYQSKMLRQELLNLEVDVRGGYITCKTKGDKRKDRYSSLMYGCYFFKEFLDDELKHGGNSGNLLDQLKAMVQTTKSKQRRW